MHLIVIEHRFFCNGMTIPQVVGAFENEEDAERGIAHFRRLHPEFDNHHIVIKSWGGKCRNNKSIKDGLVEVDRVVREIKFRAWDKNENCWFDGWCIHSNGHYRDNTVAEDEAGLPYWKDIPKNIVIMQFTGLKDKKGKEIYEWDILKDLSRKTCSVYWNEDEARFDTYKLEKLTMNNALNYEIMGNIYENPELIKDLE